MSSGTPDALLWKNHKPSVESLRKAVTHHVLSLPFIAYDKTQVTLMMVVGHARSGAVTDRSFTEKIDAASETAFKFAVTGSDAEKTVKKIAKFWEELGDAEKDSAEKRVSQIESFIQSFKK
uniref:Uncharacterized protein n=1 Tax=Chromera velia CCMP2878 TaxID=1169474 RepID=A0A0G4HMJ8_9ALVE|eukprot:Cvel_29296.t1-p1 / transcript=Cvel_29296.t1 / gene=Cvel_29296 / organism=Chromera_velia_CCMP2878 / gene_product=hypothetical protein / transcript_product=hypothetical protein / location=Cvel_scaffold3981:10302-10661(-) / protein_length=120 / sequence_SO=supercontig / SO=protein_coding / is_pseudo=false